MIVIREIGTILLMSREISFFLVKTFMVLILLNMMNHGEITGNPSCIIFQDNKISIISANELFRITKYKVSITGSVKYSIYVFIGHLMSTSSDCQSCGHGCLNYG